MLTNHSWQAPTICSKADTGPWNRLLRGSSPCPSPTYRQCDPPQQWQPRLLLFLNPVHRQGNQGSGRRGTLTPFLQKDTKREQKLSSPTYYTASLSGSDLESLPTIFSGSPFLVLSGLKEPAFSFPLLIMQFVCWEMPLFLTCFRPWTATVVAIGPLPSVVLPTSGRKHWLTAEVPHSALGDSGGPDSPSYCDHWTNFRWTGGYVREKYLKGTFSLFFSFFLLLFIFF